MNADRFQRLAGKSRNYLDTETGQIFSRRQYDKLQEGVQVRTIQGITVAAPAAKTRKGPAKSDKRKLAEQRASQAYYDKIRARTATLNERGQKVTLREVRNSADTKRLLAELKEAGADRAYYKIGKKRGKLKKRTPQQEKRMKLLLHELGLRRDIPAWVKVGETNEYIRRHGPGSGS